MKILSSLLLASFLAPWVWAIPQQTNSPAPPASSTGQAPVSSSVSTSGKIKSKPVPSFLIIGTVFNDKALSFPGVQVRIRQTGEKKFRWETYTNSRGEFAVRVPPGYDYEVVIQEKNYAGQTRSVDGKVDVQQRLSVQLEPLSKTKTGAKP